MTKLPEDNLDPPPTVNDRPPRRPILEYFHRFGGDDRFWRIFSSREKMVEGLKTFAWVAPLTLLIWVYAVREQVVQPNSPNAMYVPVRIFSSDSSEFYVENAKPDESTVNLQLTGPQQNLESVREKLTTDIPRGVAIDLGATMGPGNGQPVNIVDHIQNLEMFRNSGVTVQLSQPSEIKVNIYKVMHKENVPVSIPPDVTNLSPETRFEPATVTVSGPDFLVKPVTKVYAKLEGYDQLKQAGGHVIPSVPLEFIPLQPKLTMSVNQVNANLVVNASDVTYDIPYAVIVWKLVPATLTGFDVELDPSDTSIANVQVQGPQQAIDTIKDKSFTVKAILKIDPTDAGNTVTRSPTYELPPGVTVSEKDAARQLKFTVAPRPGQ